MGLSQILKGTFQTITMAYMFVLCRNVLHIQITPSELGRYLIDSKVVIMVSCVVQLIFFFI